RLVLPEGRVGGLLTQVGDLSAHRLRIDYGLDGVELGRQFRYLIGGIGSCHAGKPTRIRARQRIQGSPGRRAGSSSPRVSSRFVGFRTRWTRAHLRGASPVRVLALAAALAAAALAAACTSAP